MHYSYSIKALCIHICDRYNGTHSVIHTNDDAACRCRYSTLIYSTAVTATMYLKLLMTPNDRVGTF